MCIGKNKGADQLRGNREADHAFVFAKRIVLSPFYLYIKFQASSTFLCLCSSVCVGPVGKPHSWFSHEVAHIMTNRINQACLSHIIIPKDGLIQQFYSARTLLIDCQSPLQRSITSNLKFILILKLCENLPHVDHGFEFHIIWSK